MLQFLIKNNIPVDYNGKIIIPSYSKTIKLDIGLCFHAPVSQSWLEKDEDLFVFGFEPSPFAIEELKRGPNVDYLEKNIITKIFDTKMYMNKKFFLIPCALGGMTIDNESTFYMTYPNTGCSSLFDLNIHNTCGQQVVKKIQVPCFTLSSFFDCFPFDKHPLIYYIKIDAQGGDLDIIKSSGKYLSEHVVCVTIEAENTQYVGTTNSFNNIDEYMKGLDFIFINCKTTSDPTYVNNNFLSIFDQNNISQK